MKPGRVSIVGAGPGDPDLLTVKTRNRLDAADVVLHDSLVGDGVVDSIPETVTVESVGKHPGGERTTQAEINRRMVEAARRGQHVVRLKGGDPTVFGRGGEEAEHLAAAGVDFEIVPGVSSVLAGPQAAGIPLTHRDHASSLTVVTGHEDPTKADSALDWAAIAGSVDAGGTLVILMGVSRLRDNVRALREHGVDPETPVAMIERATLSDEFAVTERLDGILETAGKAEIEPPAVTVVGDVVGVGERLAAVEGATPALVGGLAAGAPEADGAATSDVPDRR